MCFCVCVCVCMCGGVDGWKKTLIYKLLWLKSVQSYADSTLNNVPCDKHSRSHQVCVCVCVCSVVQLLKPVDLNDVIRARQKVR